jgi:hypothetical protein
LPVWLVRQDQPDKDLPGAASAGGIRQIFPLKHRPEVPLRVFPKGGRPGDDRSWPP